MMAGHGAPRLRPYLPTQRFAAEPAARSFGFPDEPLEERRGNWRDVSDAPLSAVTTAGSLLDGLCRGCRPFQQQAVGPPTDIVSFNGFNQTLACTCQAFDPKSGCEGRTPRVGSPAMETFGNIGDISALVH